ncbi:MAG: hypothetical protein A2Y12_06450 [Planctomycetes bacterium GWF2_42_9]|nr:MAG: hypothetical protein A2Y12_06450 [Planctomycetes bacterium GWF2_42_9]HAL45298.1 hypothetical protein [Phycisphaerales bacterium]
MNKILQLVKRYGIIKFLMMAVDEVIHIFNKFLRELFYHWTKDDFGIKEALFWSKDIDQYMRYSKILGELKKIQSVGNQKIRILDVGAGGEGIAKFLKYSGDINKYEVYLADTNADFLTNVKLGKPVVIKGKTLSFKDNEFDIVVSVDTLEHIPKNGRNDFLKELKRVGKTVLLHFIMHDPANQYFGRDIDMEFNKWYLKNFKKENSWVVEHLNIEPPTCSEIKSILPDAVIAGTQNINVWYKYITTSASPIIGFFTGYAFLGKWKKQFSIPPYHGCFVRWQDNSN